MSLNLHQAEAIPAAARAELEQALASGDLFRYHSQNAPVTQLERAFAERLGARFALAVASCSSAIFLSLKALDLPRGAKVLIPGFTFAAVPSSVVHADCEPVLVEVGENYRMDMTDFAAKLTDDIKAVVDSHMRGHMRVDVVWFGEIPYQMARIERALRQADVFAAIGTSAQVYPAAGFVQLARAVGAECHEFNLERTACLLYTSDAADD